MNLLVVGLSHRSAPIAVLEQTAVPVADAGKVLCELLKREHVVEALLLCTCNRVEVYAIVQTFHGGLSDIIDVLAGHSAIEVDQLSGYLDVRYAAAAVEHLFSVAAGLDSMVVGEQQILSQLRDRVRERRTGRHRRTRAARAPATVTAGKQTDTSRDRNRRSRGIGDLRSSRRGDNDDMR